MDPVTNTRRGFSLIELLVAIALISVLLSLLVPALKESRKAAIRLICGTRIHQAGLHTIMYTQDFNSYYPKGQAATYLAEWNHDLTDPGGWHSGAAAQILIYGDFGSWPPPPRENPLIGGQLENRIPDSYASWLLYDCANNSDTAAWVNWNTVWYNAHTEFSAFFSQSFIPGSSTRSSKMESGSAIWAENAWSNTGELDFIDASWHDYSGYVLIEPGADIFIGMNTCRADGSADWLQGVTNRSDNFFLALQGAAWWVIPTPQ